MRFFTPAAPSSDKVPGWRGAAGALCGGSDPRLGTIGIKGAAAHLINAGEKVIIMGFELCEKPLVPRVVLWDEDNRILEYLTERVGETVGSF
ncbi:MAG: aspartate 1-decarboxylase [Verrucomicrobiales bacterium]|nr:aspartate 1-decarboxylase [Verrucomicrobiae bacterium]MCP5554058.1 aspartate 1-decarboxylase [Akkermansiaceae bacterium]